ncbi:hypothetical protein HXX76_001106 [Chlamydomonas incerta]|uniref:ACT domain-containing protein n=1 Tax=Chlamydomonas incerta TaxID=51695 RepID=A0A836B0P7_CHLIN|nr:hypothetical protein HXX76_001106 [Chlamydomonas incerta]|eukprot:KAG2444350.1 hypothetical protein HXX76_001106 [Chlamydomonas incerta]
MNSILLRTLQPPRTPSLLAFSDYREAEQANARHSSTTANGALLEYETLELRVHPPNVVVDNDSYSDRTLITLDSANRPGTLVEVVQLLTELGLCVTKARISSDGGWFVDEFHVTDGGKKVTNERKLRAIRKVLSVDTDPGSDSEADAGVFEEASQCSTVFELAGNDRIGLLAEVIALLKNNGCEVRSAAVWTHNHRVAFVISVLEASPSATAGAVAAPGVHHTHLHNAATHHHGIAAAPGGGAGGGSCPIKDGIKLARLRQLLLGMMDPSGQDSVVNVATTKGLIHYERRLHQLLLKEEEAQWRRAGELAAAYEAELAELQAMQERRWAGGAWSSSAAAAGAAALPAVTGRARPEPIAIYASGGSALPSPASLLSAAPSPSMAAVSAGAVVAGASSSAAGTPGAGLSAATTPTGAASQAPTGQGQGAGAAAAAAAAAAAQVQSALGSPLICSPDNSVHGGRAVAASVGAASAADGGGAAASATGGGPDAGASGGSSAESNGQPSVLRASSAASGAATPNGTSSGAAEGAAAPSNRYGGKAPAATLAAPPSPSPPPAPSASSAQKPEVSIQHTKQHNYWMINIRCRDRQKLLFDTVCTLADLNYDVYHGAVDCEVERDRANGQPLSIAVQTFYLRPRYGDCLWDAKRAAKLKYMLEVAIQRRQPTGTKVHISGVPASAGGGAGGAAGGAAGAGSTAGASDLPALTAVWRDFGLCISRAKVRALAGAAGEHTFYLVDRNGLPPADTVVQAACQQIGGVRLARPDAGLLGTSAGAGAAGVGGSVGGKAGAGKGGAVVPPGEYKFGFTVYSRAGWGGRDINGAAESV